MEKCLLSKINIITPRDNRSVRDRLTSHFISMTHVKEKYEQYNEQNGQT